MYPSIVQMREEKLHKKREDLKSNFYLKLRIKTKIKNNSSGINT